MDVDILWGELIASLFAAIANRADGNTVSIDSPWVPVKLFKASARVISAFIFTRAAVALALYYLGAA